MQTILNRNALSGDYIGKGLSAQELAKADLEIVRRLAAGDENALAELYQRYSKPLFNYLHRLVRDPESAEDLLQEVFVVFWQKAATFQGRSSFKTWAFRIAHNKAVSWLRKLKPIDDVEMMDLPSDASPEADSFQNWQSELVHEAMQALSANHRAAIELIYVYDFTYREAAKVLDTPVGTVKSRVMHGLKNLGGHLSQLGISSLEDVDEK
jgi:RNA polymerase sigma-70 factor (ECF subfamily)